MTFSKTTLLKRIWCHMLSVAFKYCRILWTKQCFRYLPILCLWLNSNYGCKDAYSIGLVEATLCLTPTSVTLKIVCTSLNYYQTMDIRTTLVKRRLHVLTDRAVKCLPSLKATIHSTCRQNRGLFSINSATCFTCRRVTIKVTISSEQAEASTKQHKIVEDSRSYKS
jgi:hypothetical protein